VRIPIPVVGGDYAHSSIPFDRQETLNMFPEPGMSSSSATGVLRRFPGLKLFATLTNGSGQIRSKGMYVTANERLFVVRGSALIELSTAGAESSSGTLISTEGPISMVDNGLQMIIADGTQLYEYILATNVLSVISDVDAPDNSPVVDFVDQYVFGFNPHDVVLGRFQHSNLSDVTDWPSADEYNAESSPDELVSLTANNGKIWAYGSKSTEVWRNTGAARGTWNRIPGTTKDIGCGAAHSVAKMSGRVFWLGASKEGSSIIYMSGDGFSAVEISTKPLESWINSLSDVSDSIGFTFQHEGHYFYMITFKSGDRTYCYDLTTNNWFRVTYRDTTTGYLGRSRIVASAFFGNKNYVGDYAAGLIYELDSDTYSDNGDPQSCERYFPYFQAQKQRIFWKSLQLDIETGVGLTSGRDPKIQLRWSDDQGRTFGNWEEMSIGKLGEYDKRVRIDRIGWSYDRVYHIRCTEPVKFNVLNDAIGEVRVGRS